MTAIIPQKRKRGMRYTVQIRIKRNGTVIHFESKTFDKKPLAKDWAGQRESVLKWLDVLEQVRYEAVTVFGAS